MWRRAESSAAGALQISEDLDVHRADEGELTRVRFRAVEQRPHRAHDQLDVARLEELDRRETALDVLERELEVFGRWRRCELLRWSDPTCRVTGREMQLVQSQQRRLGEVQRRVLGSRDDDGGVQSLENNVWQSAVLAPERHSDRTLFSR